MVNTTVWESGVAMDSTVVKTVATRKSAPVTTEGLAEAVTEVRSDLAEVDGVVSVIDPFVVPEGPESPAAAPLVAADGDGFLVVVEIDPELGETAEDTALEEVEALLRDPSFRQLVAHYEELAHLADAMRRARLARLAREMLERLVRMADLRAIAFVLHEQANGRDPGVSLAIAVEKHVTAIFRKLRIAPAETDHRRVQAVLAYLRADDH